MFLRFAKLWNWEISSADTDTVPDVYELPFSTILRKSTFSKLCNSEITEWGNWYCPLCFYILPSYETEKSVERITDTVPYFSTFCQVMKLEVSAEDNWYCPLYFYVLPKYGTGKSVQQILILSLMFLHFATLWD